LAGEQNRSWDKLSSLSDFLQEIAVRMTSSRFASASPIVRQTSCALVVSQDGHLAVNNPTVAAEQFLALVRGELHLHCLYDPSFRPPRAKIEKQIDAGIDCFMARYGAPEASTL
jgi:hypothetical protein